MQGISLVRYTVLLLCRDETPPAYENDFDRVDHAVGIELLLYHQTKIVRVGAKVIEKTSSFGSAKIRLASARDSLRILETILPLQHLVREQMVAHELQVASGNVHVELQNVNTIGAHLENLSHSLANLWSSLERDLYTKFLVTADGSTQRPENLYVPVFIEPVSSESLSKKMGETLSLLTVVILKSTELVQGGLTFQQKLTISTSLRRTCRAMRERVMCAHHMILKYIALTKPLGNLCDRRDKNN